MSASDCKVTVLVDNSAEDGLATEHGLSLWIETGDMRILFDTGQGMALEHNVDALGIDLRDADALVLSHGHYDHTGDVARVLGMCPQIHVYCHPDVMLERYSVRDGAATSIGMPKRSMAAMETLPSERLHWVQQPIMLSDSIGLTGPIPREAEYEDTGGPFFLDSDGQRPDPIEDDIALWIRRDESLFVCVGCAHAGIVNTVSYIERLNPSFRIRTILGGLHLVNATSHRLQETADALRRTDAEVIVPIHCTGEAGTVALQATLGDRAVIGAAGMTWRC